MLLAFMVAGGFVGVLAAGSHHDANPIMKVRISGNSKPNGLPHLADFAVMSVKRHIATHYQR